MDLLPANAPDLKCALRPDLTGTKLEKFPISPFSGQPDPQDCLSTTACNGRLAVL